MSRIINKPCPISDFIKRQDKGSGITSAICEALKDRTCKIYEWETPTHTFEVYTVVRDGQELIMAKLESDKRSIVRMGNMRCDCCIKNKKEKCSC